MKNVFIFISLFFCFNVVFAQSQNLNVVVAHFDIQGGVTQHEANVLYKLFFDQLILSGNNKINVIERSDLQFILNEINFQLSGWSDPVKTAHLGRVLNAQAIVRGRLMKTGNWLYWNVTLIDLRTAHIKHSSRERYSGIERVFSSLPNFCNQLVEKVNEQGPGSELFKNVAVPTFNVQGDITHEEAGIITELFISSLVSTRRVNVIDRTSFDKLLQEHDFQNESNFSNPQKTAVVGRVSNAQYVIRGDLMKVNNIIYWTARVLDLNTAQGLSSASIQLNSLENVWDNLLNFSRQIVSLLPPPNLFVGRWQGKIIMNEREFLYILNIQANGSVIVERYDTIIVTRAQSIDIGETLLNNLVNLIPMVGILITDFTFVSYDYNTTYGVPNRNGRGTGTYESINKNGNDIIITKISLRLNGIDSGIPQNSTINVSLNLNNPNNFSTNLVWHYFIEKKLGIIKEQKAVGSTVSFVRIN